MPNVLAGGLPNGEVALSAAVAAASQGTDVCIVNAGVSPAGRDSLRHDAEFADWGILSYDF